VCDDGNPNSQCDTAEVEVTVNPVADDPQANNDEDSTMEP